MIKKIIVIDNFFDDVDYIIELSKKFEYHKNNNIMTQWSGRRTLELLSTEPDTFTPIVNQSVDKIINFTFGKNVDMSMNYSWNAFLAFHKMTDEVLSVPEHCYHKDISCVYAGVVYLTPNAPKEYGTIIKDENKTIVVENVFNRLVIYRADLSHAPVGGFGKSYEDDNRLTMNMFFKELTIQLSGD